MIKNAYVIANSMAGGGTARALIPKITRKLRNKEVSYELFETRKFGHATYLATQLKEDFPVIVVGGDGTLSQVVTGLKNSNKLNSVIYLPAGSGNDFARSFGIALNPEEALEHALTGQSHQVYIGKIHENGHDTYFTNNLGIGFDAEIVQLAENSKSKKLLNKLHLGRLSYPAQAISAILKTKCFSVNLADQEINNCYMLMVTKTPFAGGGIKLSKDQSVFEPRLDLIMIKKDNNVQLIKDLLAFATGNLKASKTVTLLSADHFSYKADQAPAHLDGEIFNQASYDLEISTSFQEFIQ
ncbi:MAG: diacylglycerol kinase family lipid kinase [Lactobacillus sp.]|nr:diacylglycerol kinase family lipid kinase [Lactobacillus sp.]